MLCIVWRRIALLRRLPRPTTPNGSGDLIQKQKFVPVQYSQAIKFDGSLSTDAVLFLQRLNEGFAADYFFGRCFA